MNGTDSHPAPAVAALVPAAPETAPAALASRLLGDLCRGRREALGELYDAVSRELYGLALWRTGSREDAADVVQEVFVRLMRTGADPGRVRDGRSYLLRMTQHVAIDHLRKRRPAEQRDAVYLRHIVGLSWAEVGRATGVSLFTAASRGRLGLKRLRKRMGASR